MDRATDAVGHFHVNLGQSVSLVSTSIFEISQGARVDHVANVESLNSLVLGNAASASFAIQKLSYASSVASVASYGMRVKEE